MRHAILDTGPLIAFLDRAEQNHRWAVEQVEELEPPLLVCEPVLAEPAPWPSAPGKRLTEAVITALRERLEREQRKDQIGESLAEDVMEIGRHCASLPLLDRRQPDEILGYDGNGLPP